MTPPSGGKTTVEPSRVLTFRELQASDFAACRHCSFSRRGASVEIAHVVAEEHALRTGHEVTVRSERRTLIRPVERS